MTNKWEAIKHTQDGTLLVPDFPIIPFIEGDGTGPEIWRAARHVLDKAIFRAYGNSRRIQWREVLAGEKAFHETGFWLPEDTLSQMKTYRVSIKGPLTTPVGGGFRSINVTLRQELDLYSCIRPVKYIPGVPSPMRKPEGVDMVVFRENTEDVYAGIEWEAGSPLAKKIIEMVEVEEARKIRDDSGIGLKPISFFGTCRLIRMAIKYALENRRKSVTFVHKGNIMKFTEGAFRNWGYKVAREEFAGKVVTEEEVERDYKGRIPSEKVVIKDRIADAMFQQILLRPEEYDVLATPNLNGDYISDALAAMVGGLGMAPGGNIGDGYAVFEATHGSAPKHAGKDKVNPSSLILSGAMMLEYLGWKEAAGLIQKGLIATIVRRTVTYDLARQMDDAIKLKCSQFAEAIVENM